MTNKNYENHCNFIMKSDKSMNYVDIQPVKVQINDTTTVDRLYIEKFVDYGRQPTANGYTYSGVITYKLGDYIFEKSLNNLDSTNYSDFKTYGWTFLFWVIADSLGLNILNENDSKNSK